MSRLNLIGIIYYRLIERVRGSKYLKEKLFWIIVTTLFLNLFCAFISTFFLVAYSLSKPIYSIGIIVGLVFVVGVFVHGDASRKRYLASIEDISTALELEKQLCD